MEWSRPFFCCRRRLTSLHLGLLARRKHRVRHGGGRARVELEDAPADPEASTDDLLAIDEALDVLAQEDPVKAELVKLRYFAGLTLEEVANCQGVSLATAKRRWTVARAWLYDALSPADGSEFLANP